MKALFVRAAPALLAAAAVSLAGAAPAQALTSCSIATPCLPQGAGFTTTLGGGPAPALLGTSPALARSSAATRPPAMTQPG